MVFRALFKMTEIREKAVCFTDLLSNWEEKEVNPHVWRRHWRTQTSQALGLAGPCLSWGHWQGGLHEPDSLGTQTS